MSENKAVIALTGATGFVGREVLNRLVRDGYHVRSLVRPSSIDKVGIDANVTWVVGELDDPESDALLVQDADVVVHMAGLITARTKSQYERINAHAVGSLANAAKKAGASRFVYLSSLAAKAPELSLYAWSKDTFTAVKYGFRLFFLLQTFNKPSAWEKYKLTDVIILPAPKKMLNPTLVPQKKKSHIGLREMSGA